MVTAAREGVSSPSYPIEPSYPATAPPLVSPFLLFIECLEQVTS